METHKIVLICGTIVLATFFLSLRGCDSNDPEEMAAQVQVIKAKKEKEVALAKEELRLKQEGNKVKLEKLRAIEKMVDKGIPAAAAHCAVYGPQTTSSDARKHCLLASKLQRIPPRAK